jgi:2-keto-myo-inositol isomerase
MLGVGRPRVGWPTVLSRDAGLRPVARPEEVRVDDAQINGASRHVLHVNDYPQAADSSTLNDGSRIYGDDGVAPYRHILRDLRDSGFRGYLSLELFNRNYWTRSADDNLKAGIEKIRATIKQALA